MVHQIDHPEDENRTLPVEVVDEESHRGVEMVRVEAVSPNVTIRDQSGESPWVFRSDVEEIGS
jgi:hypothetical protein